MKQTTFTPSIVLDTTTQANYYHYLILFFSGLMGPLGFAPFHMPGFTIISLAIFFSFLLKTTLKQSVILGFLYGMGFFGLGVSWVMISIHDYGQMNYAVSGFITLIFIMYLSLYPALVAYLFKVLKSERSAILAVFSFSVLWCLSEYLRSHLMTGFPWLLLGISQIDTPFKYLAPILGISGLSFFCLISAGLLSLAITSKRYYLLSAFVIVIVSPSLLKNIQWTTLEKEPVTIGAIQGNLSMRDKWDDALFWKLLKYYEKSTDKLLGKQLIIFPESAIPLPARYLNNYLKKLDTKVQNSNSALLLGIVQPTDETETHYYNAITSYGHAYGKHLKRQLVPFGEYIPAPFVALNRWFNLPEPNILPGKAKQELIRIFNHPIASLICYEIAYPDLLRQQLPLAQWIVSVSDNGWFGHSLASYQQLQISQMLSLLTGRFQVLVNNDGLSSVIDAQGNIVEGLPSFSSGLLQSELFPAQGSTPWVILNEYPMLIFCFVCFIFIIFFRISQQ